MDVGVFIPIGNNGWLISKSSPQYMPSFELNKTIVQKAEQHGFDFALSMIKLRGFGGDTEFWDHNLESFTLMAGLAAVTERIKLYASTAILTLPPALVARMVSTIDSIAPGRIGVNIVTGWAPKEYSQMGLWPGDDHFRTRYRRAEEYVQVLRELTETGRSDLKGEFYEMDDCVLSPKPGHIDIVSAGQSDTGIRFAAENTEFDFLNGVGINTPTAMAPHGARLLAATEASGRTVGALGLFMVIADETDELAMAKWHDYHANADVSALDYRADEAGADVEADETSTARTISLPEGAVNFNMGTLVGSYESVARMLDELSTVPGLAGVMLTFDDFVAGVDAFGERIQPLMTSRRHITTASSATVPA